MEEEGEMGKIPLASRRAAGPMVSVVGSQRDLVSEMEVLGGNWLLASRWKLWP